MYKDDSEECQDECCYHLFNRNHKWHDVDLLKTWFSIVLKLSPCVGMVSNVRYLVIVQPLGQVVIVNENWFSIYW